MAFFTPSHQRFAVFGVFVFASIQGNAQTVTSAKGVTTLTVSNQAQAVKVDFVHAKAMPMPTNPFPQDSTRALVEALGDTPKSGASAFSPGAEGSGKTSPVFVGQLATDDTPSGVSPQDFGTSNHPFTTARADLSGLVTYLNYPYRAAGKLFFIGPGGGSYMCSASLIKPGIVVTAAHCVANFGASQFWSGWQFIPGYWNGVAPFGTWTAANAYVLTSYFNGSDSCAVSGVVCADDVAVIVLNAQSGSYAGNRAGWFGYWYGGGYSGSGLFQITQLGYPAGLNNAHLMERTDSYGYMSSSNSNNTIIGSNMDGGSSGGPWLVNFGLPYTLTGETNGSGYTFTNAVVGVTSWGYTSTAPKEQGASPFTSGNIGTLVTTACNAYPAACS